MSCPICKGCGLFRIPNFLVSDECEAIDELIKAYRKGDSEKFMKWTTKPAITCIYPVVVVVGLCSLSRS
jgi:hypothetical protein